MFKTVTVKYLKTILGVGGEFQIQALKIYIKAPGNYKIWISWTRKIAQRVRMPV